jgi:hypothetical protein
MGHRPRASNGTTIMKLWYVSGCAIVGQITGCMNTQRVGEIGRNFNWSSLPQDRDEQGTAEISII